MCGLFNNVGGSKELKKPVCCELIKFWKKMLTACYKMCLNDTIFQHPSSLYCSMSIAGYVSVCVQLYCMLVFTVFHYMFRPTWFD
jgi:hypothetical protein